MAQQNQPNQHVENVKNTSENMFKGFGDMFKSAFDAGLKFQQDMFKTVTGTCENGCSFDAFRNRCETTAMDSFNWVRKNAELTQKMVDDSCRNGVEMVRKTSDTSRMDNNKDMFAQSREISQNAIDAAKNNMDVFAKTTSQMMEVYSDFVNKTMTMTEKKAGK